MKTRVVVAASAAIACAFALTSCGSNDSTEAGAETLTVFAAASLQNTFTEIGEQFEAANPGVTVEFSFAGSSSLVTQLVEGAPADVFAAADTKTMGDVVDAGLAAGEPGDFATNVLTIVTESGNPENITSLEDLTREGLSVVVCAPQVPCGAATERVEESSGATLTPVSEESSVTDVLGKVTSGQADAGLVYVTDAKDAGESVTAIPFPESAGAVNTYPIARLADTDNAELAAEFVDFATGEQGRAILAEAGFGAP
ncbi:molybdate ABC transporter substrate-binding protein [Rhodococcus sp. NPDC060090]|uniref:molybdate ABC transporter substrate-binding protein n=1 Tax=Rhodococcus sp. NPDC060090 TaxID=3347056 RepID=UPI00366962CC